MNPKNGILNPNENLIIPSWINADYFKDILAKDEPESVAVKNFKPVAAIPPGENYASIMLRIHMDLEMKDGSVEHKTYVLKTMIDNDKGGAIFNSLDLFPKELEMYQKYLPAFEGLYKAVGWNIQLAPKCYLAEKIDGRFNFVFEDLSVKNYKNLDRLEGCDFNHMKQVLHKLAEFHAAGALYEERNGKYPKLFQSGFVEPTSGMEFSKRMFGDKVVSYKKAMTKWGLEDAEKYINKFPTLDQYLKCCLCSLEKQTKNFKVLCHGDFWSSNIMFCYLTSGKLSDLIIVDYQYCKWGSPIEDLLFLITISAAKDVRIKEFDNFIAIYHERLVECLKVLGYKKSLPKLRDLHKDMFDEKNSFYAFFACFNHLPIIMWPTDKDSTIENFSRPDEIGEQLRMKICTNPHFVEGVRDLFPFYHRRGLFNFEDYTEN